MEFVLVVRRQDLFPRSAPHGFVALSAEQMQDGPLATVRRGGFFVERAAAETEPRWKQIIPYCLIRFGDQLFVTRRLARGGETRLHGRRSIGIGGHINPVDAAEGGMADRFHLGLRREVEEEVQLPGDWSPTPLGWINDDTTEVGAVHVGLVFGIRATSPAVAVRETDKLTGALEALVELRNSWENDPHWETWSRLVLVRASEWVTRF
jgi:predicted NUDIX family phosphoesterase